MVQIEFLDGDLSYVDEIRLNGRLDDYRFSNLFERLTLVFGLDCDDFFLLHQIKEDLNNDDDCNYDFVRIVFRSYKFTEEQVSNIVSAFLFGFKVVL